MADSIDLIVVDGGGSGSRLRAVGADNGIVAEEMAGPSSLTLGVDQAWASIGWGITAIADRTGSDLRAVPLFCGLAGGRSVERGDALRAKAAAHHAGSITIVTDGFASLIGAHGGRAGIALAIGTGVAAFALGRDGQIRSASAWGFRIGDEGGGAWLGQRALTRLSRHRDGREPQDALLFDRLRDRVGPDFNAIQRWLGPGDATQFATLSPIVVTAAADGCPVAGDLMRDAGRELSLAVGAVDGGGPIALLGGLAAVFAPHLAADWGTRLVRPSGNALDGLVIAARRGWRDEDAIPPCDMRHD